jgi:hypothetical protein
MSARRPSSRERFAAVSPASPAPTAIKSNSSAILEFLRLRRRLGVAFVLMLGIVANLPDTCATLRQHTLRP